jgi:hypothetical protein
MTLKKSWESKFQVPFSSGEEGTKLPWGASSQMFDKKKQGYFFSKSNIFYTIRKLLKHRCPN